MMTKDVLDPDFPAWNMNLLCNRRERFRKLSIDIGMYFRSG